MKPIDKWTILDFDINQVSASFYKSLLCFEPKYTDLSGGEHLYSASLLEEVSEKELQAFRIKDFNIMKEIAAQCAKKDSFYFRIINIK